MLIALSPDSTPCTITVLDADGTELFSWDSTKNFSSVLFSSPELEQGAAYTVTAGRQFRRSHPRYHQLPG